MRRLFVVSCFLGLAACSSTPPANWARGGAVIDIPRARYIKSDLMVDILPGGQVMLNGEHEFTIDRAGRVFDADSEPLALLEPSGNLVGPDQTPLGQVGSMHASHADESYAYLSVTPMGEVVRYDEDGERSNYGIWMGCNVSPRTNQACTLVTHLLSTRNRIPERAYGGGSVGPSIGIGVGVGFGR
jgi:hypothetical protein